MGDRTDAADGRNEEADGRVPTRRSPKPRRRRLKLSTACPTLANGEAVAVADDMYDTLSIIRWPDARLKKPCAPIDTFDDDLRRLADRMLDLMRAAKGVGLAAPQVGINRRLFVMNHSGEPGDDRVYVNPTLAAIEGDAVAEEGCLSLPEIHIDVVRPDRVAIVAQTLDGAPVTLERDGFEARVWQHETDHLLGILLTDRMSFSDRMKHRKRLRELETKHRPAAGKLPAVAHR